MKSNRADVGGEAPAAGGTPVERLGQRALRTRQRILDTSKQLFLERGYAGTSVNSITTACGISRAGLYTYFRDKREIFEILGTRTHREILTVVESLENLPQPASRTDFEVWVREYFDFMNEHGPFILAAQSAPPDEEIRIAGNRLQMRVAWLIGLHLRNRQKTPTQTPEALGLTIHAMLDRSWFHLRGQGVPVDEDDIITTISENLVAVLAG
ncbi:TetR/AcrR family transcriptional regulator [Parafrankia sp. FMc2]|uniref:TetR/AcrR family transcriptional regulator n=1 Tax=Parafrankia sp. FMc2 TaxID=3233196 RepID=UPI0034D566E6